jgi:transcriptional regulator with XRE-family HTH domain
MARRISPSIVEPTLEELLPTPETMQLFQQFAAALAAGQLVRGWREHAGLTQKQLAERLRLTQARVSAIEKGRGRDGPTYGLMQRLATACGVNWPTGVAVATTDVSNVSPAELSASGLAAEINRSLMTIGPLDTPQLPAVRATAPEESRPVARRRDHRPARHE